jgi:hypothetical protein
VAALYGCLLRASGRCGLERQRSYSDTSRVAIFRYLGGYLYNVRGVVQTTGRRPRHCQAAAGPAPLGRGNSTFPTRADLSAGAGQSQSYVSGLANCGSGRLRCGRSPRGEARRSANGRTQREILSEASTVYTARYTGDRRAVMMAGEDPAFRCGHKLHKLKASIETGVGAARLSRVTSRCDSPAGGASSRASLARNHDRSPRKFAARQGLLPVRLSRSTLRGCRPTPVADAAA